MKKVLVFLSIVVVLTACVSVSKSILDTSFSLRPVPQQRVSVLLASLGDTLPSNCTRVALLHASAAELASEGRIYDKLREEAGKLGANTLYIQSMEDVGIGERIVGALMLAAADKDSDAIALHCDDT